MSKSSTVEAVLLRNLYSPHQTYGMLRVFSGQKLLASAYTLELPWRDNQRNISCIPEIDKEDGVLMYPHVSPKFGNTFWIKPIEGRSEILIHVANFVASDNPRTSTSDLRGCIGVGKGYKYIDGDEHLDLHRSGDAMKHLLEQLWNEKEKIPFSITSTQSLIGMSMQPKVIR